MYIYIYIYIDIYIYIYEIMLFNVLSISSVVQARL